MARGRRHWSLLLSWAAPRRFGLSAPSPVPPRLSPGTLAHAARTFLWDQSQRSPFRPSRRRCWQSGFPIPRVLWCRRGDSNSHGSPHYDLNVARLPIPPLRPVVTPPQNGITMTADGSIAIGLRRVKTDTAGLFVTPAPDFAPGELSPGQGSKVTAVAQPKAIRSEIPCTLARSAGPVNGPCSKR